MEKKYKNIDDFFANAKIEKPVYNINNIKTMLDKGRFTSVNLANQPNLIKQLLKLKGIKAMSITASIIAGVMALSVLMPNKDAENKTESSVQNAIVQETRVNPSNANEPTLIVEINSVDAINNIDNKSGVGDKNNSLLALNEKPNKQEKVTSILDATVNVSGINIVKLSPSQIQKLGVAVDDNDNSISFNVFLNNPTRTVLYAEKQDELDNMFTPYLDIKIAPSLVTDYKGNRRMMAFEEEGVSMMQIQSKFEINDSTSIDMYQMTEALKKQLKEQIENGDEIIFLSDKSQIDSIKKYGLPKQSSQAITTKIRLHNSEDTEVQIRTKQISKNMKNSDSQLFLGSEEIDVSNNIIMMGLDLNDIQDKMNKHILINKLIPVLVPCPTQKDKDFAFILWYNPTKELLDVLPSKVKNELNREMLKLATTDDYCGVQTGDDSYFDVWRACSGAIKNLNAYPNPCKDKIAINFNLDKSRKITVTLHDLAGNRVAILDNSMMLNSGEFNLEYNLSDYPAGMYLIVVQDNKGERAVQRIIKN